MAKKLMVAGALLGAAILVGPLAIPGLAGGRVPQAEASKRNPVPLDQASIDRARPLYEKECASCHGSTGAGDGPRVHELRERPKDLRNRRIQARSDGTLAYQILVGEHEMPAFRELSETQRWDLVNYMRHLAKADSGQAAPPAKKAPRKGAGF